MKKVIFSGIQPSGNLHIGNYIGAIQQWVKLQEETEAFFCIVDLHAITVAQYPKTLKEKVLDTAALYLACGIDPKKSHIFVQSENPDHSYLAWLLNCITPLGQLERMTQFKDKSLKQKEGTTAGLFDYPVLMAADILLYQTDEVPVGEDQKQHTELTRDLAEKFNRDFGQVFKIPKPLIQKETARIMSLADPQSKMSKSDNDPLGTINLLDSEEQIREKIKKAVTDSGSEVKYGNDKPAISNLLTIYSVFSGESPIETEASFKRKTYSEFKEELTKVVNKKLKEIREEYQRIRNDEKALRQILDEGAKYARSKSSQTLKEVKEKMGLSS
ncbi:MAG: tryptophan--tRNA ligase [Candidatus Levybacteria bacterium RIFCSPLOWO2_01_FULL_36_13]|nr:MAG: tryptophan--tRNA ligase [Candidatus Levybacteria bacterium RIFCSPLOWO2_01_FULL_36_13]